MGKGGVETARQEVSDLLTLFSVFCFVFYCCFFDLVKIQERSTHCFME